MKHKEYKKIYEAAETAILFIHGIVGTPNQFQMFLPLIPEGMSVHNLLLDGHGMTPKEFSHTSMQRWEAQVRQAVDELSHTHRKVCLVAHSMGTLLSVEQALLCKKINRLFLLAVPLKISIKPQMIFNAHKVYMDKIQPDDREALAAKDSYGIGNDKNLLHYIGWIPRYLELFTKIRQTRKLLHRIDVPCRVYQSARDEMVSIRSRKYLEQNPNICVTTLENSGHYYYDEADRGFLLNEFKDWICEILETASDG